MLASISVLISKATCLKIGNFLLHPNIPQIIYKTNSLLCALQIFMLSNFSLFIILFFFFLSCKNATVLPIIWVRALVFTSCFLSTSSCHLWCDSISSSNSDFTCLKFFNFHLLSSPFTTTDWFLEFVFFYPVF